MKEDDADELNASMADDELEMERHDGKLFIMLVSFFKNNFLMTDHGYLNKEKKLVNILFTILKIEESKLE